jgi:uncharacterized coiled-coil protein SlyX
MDLRAQLERRLTALHEELAAGRRLLADLQARQAEVQDTMLRVAGAIQVLEEELAAAPEVEPGPTASVTGSSRTDGGR